MSEGRKILFWEDAPGWRPQDFVRQDIGRVKREQLAHILANGNLGQSYKGFAECRLCKAALGSSDLSGLGFVWPQKAEHYVLEHDVWTPGRDALYAAMCEEASR